MTSQLLPCFLLIMSCKNIMQNWHAMHSNWLWWRVFSVYCHFKRFYMQVFSFKIHYVWYFNLQNNSTKFYHFVFLHSWVKLSVRVHVVPVQLIYHNIITTSRMHEREWNGILMWYSLEICYYVCTSLTVQGVPDHRENNLNII
jgi:hypothetical protein